MINCTRLLTMFMLNCHFLSVRSIPSNRYIYNTIIHLNYALYKC